MEEPADDGDGKVWRYRKEPAAAVPTAAASLAPAMPAPDGLPAWLERNAAAEPAPPEPVSPASAYDERALVRVASGADRKTALARGVIVHRLLQALPDLPAAARAQAAHRHLDRAAREFSAEERDSLAEQALRILADSRFAALFEPGSRAEVPIVGHVLRGGRRHPVSGQIDRLAIGADTILIADYKTNRPAPRQLDEVPKPYILQLALYRAVLSELYPGHAIRAALIWTDVPDLMEISADVLDASLSAFTAG